MSPGFAYKAAVFSMDSWQIQKTKQNTRLRLNHSLLLTKTRAGLLEEGRHGDQKLGGDIRVFILSSTLQLR